MLIVIREAITSREQWTESAASRRASDDQSPLADTRAPPGPGDDLVMSWRDGSVAPTITDEIPDWFFQRVACRWRGRWSRPDCDPETHACTALFDATVRCDSASYPISVAVAADKRAVTALPLPVTHADPEE